MDSYREFWNNLILGSDYLYPSSLGRYWAGVAIFAVICLAIGLASSRVRVLPAIATLAIVALYLIALVPFAIWTASCTGCGASFSYDTARSNELYLLHTTWGGFFAMGIAAIWIGVLLSRGASAIMAKRIKP